MAANQNFQGQACSAIEATWPQNETIAQGILQHLNLRDVWNMRKTNKTMNMLLKGHRRPNNPNTTKSFIAASCDESRNAPIPAPPVPCTNGPQADVLMKYCEVANEHGNNQGGPFNLCQDCLDHNHQFRDYEEDLNIQGYWLSACKTCQDEEENAFPWGRNTCTCKAEIRGEWRCDRCCRRVMNEVVSRRAYRRFLRLSSFYRDRQGNTYFDFAHPKQGQGCICGRDCAGAQAGQMAVRFCLGCKGMIVAPSNRPKKNGRVIIKRSERIKRKREEEEDVKRGNKKVA